MQTTCKLEGGGGQKSGKFANVIYERPLGLDLSNCLMNQRVENIGKLDQLTTAWLNLECFDESSASLLVFEFW